MFSIVFYCFRYHDEKQQSEPETGTGTGTDSGPRTGTRILTSKGTETGLGVRLRLHPEAASPIAIAVPRDAATRHKTRSKSYAFSP